MKDRSNKYCTSNRLITSGKTAVKKIILLVTGASTNPLGVETSILF